MQLTAKKTLAVLLVLCMVIGFIPMGAQAAVLDGEKYITQQLSLGEDLVLHLRASLPDKYADLAKNATGIITYAGKTETYKMGDILPDENGMYDLPVEMAVAEMTENINVVLKGKYLGAEMEAINENYSIRDYLVKIIEGDFSQTTQELCLELLNMGAWAQLYFNHNISNLANTGYSTSASHSVPEESPDVSIEGNVNGISFYGTSVRFLSKTAVRFYFQAKGGVEGYTFTINGAEAQPVAKDGMYYIETSGINPQDMSKEISVNVTDGSTTLSVDYAPIWYFIRTYNKTENEYSKGLMEAAYSYYKTAETYTTKISMDVEITTLGNSYEDIELGFYPLGFEGSIHNECPERVTVKAGTTTNVKFDQGKFLVDGEFLGIGVVVFGGPEWNTTLGDGSSDKHAFTISNMRLEGPDDRIIDLRNATVTTGFGGSNVGGTATIANNILTVTNGIRYDGHMITFNEVNTYLKLDVHLTTLGNYAGQLEVGFYPHNFAGNAYEEFTDRVLVTAGATTTVYLDVNKYLVDGELPGIGFMIFGGPEWNTELEPGVFDRHAVTISNVCLEGVVNWDIDMTNAVVTTPMANANGGGTATVIDGSICVTGGYRYDGHMITFATETEPEVTEPEVTEPEVTEPPVTEPPVVEPDTYISLDMLITTTDNATDSIEVRFFPYNYAGSVGDDCTDMVHITAGTVTNVKLDLNNYLVDGELTGIGFAIMSGPAWDDAEGDRHTVTISNVKLEGAQTQGYDLSKSVWASGTNAGYSWANGWGTATIGSSIVITGGIQYDGHKISLVKEPDTYIVLDMLLTTLGNSNELVEIGFFPYNFTGDINDNTDKIKIPAGTQTTVKLDLSKYLVNGEFNGIGFAIFGGPEWNSTLPDGSADRHTLTISSAKLEGKDAKDFDLKQSVWTNGGNAGYTNANGSGTAAIDSSIVITNGFRYDGHKISLVEDTNTYIYMDVLVTTLGNSADPIELRFYSENFAGSVHEGYTDLVMVTAGTKTTVRLNAKDYLVDDKLTGIGVGIFGGPEWNTELADGTLDRHNVVISNVRLGGAQEQTINLSNATVSTGLPGSNVGGAIAVVDGTVVISGGYRYDGHKITF